MQILITTNKTANFTRHHFPDLGIRCAGKPSKINLDAGDVIGSKTASAIKKQARFWLATCNFNKQKIKSLCQAELGCYSSCSVAVRVT